MNTPSFFVIEPNTIHDAPAGWRILLTASIAVDFFAQNPDAMATVTLEVRQNDTQAWYSIPRLALSQETTRTVRPPAGLSPVQFADPYQYRVMVTDQAGVSVGAGVYIAIGWSPIGLTGPERIIRAAELGQPQCTVPFRGTYINQLSADDMPDFQRRTVYPAVDPGRDDRVGHWVCAPAGLGMLLRHFGVSNNATELPNLAQSCFDREVKLYGVWGAVMRVVHQRLPGMVGVTSTGSSAAELAEYLRTYGPVIVSMAWRSGELPQMGLDISDGHVVVVVGIDQDFVQVVDPYGNDPQGFDQDGLVVRFVPTAAFIRAWVGHQGYIGMAVQV
jgi:hypothetical protein